MLNLSEFKIDIIRYAIWQDEKRTSVKIAKADAISNLNLRFLSQGVWRPWFCDPWIPNKVSCILLEQILNFPVCSCKNSYVCVCVLHFHEKQHKWRRWFLQMCRDRYKSHLLAQRWESESIYQLPNAQNWRFCNDCTRIAPL